MATKTSFLLKYIIVRLYDFWCLIQSLTFFSLMSSRPEILSVYEVLFFHNLMHLQSDNN